MFLSKSAGQMERYMLLYEKENLLALILVIGGVKYIDEAGDILKVAAKHGDDAARIMKMMKINKKASIRHPHIGINQLETLYFDVALRKNTRQAIQDYLRFLLVQHSKSFVSSDKVILNKPRKP